MKKLLIFSIVLLIIGGSLNWISASYIEKTFQLTATNDLFFYKFNFKDLSIYTEILVIMSYILMLVFIINKKMYNYIPYYIIIIAIFQFLRASMIILTPLATPYGNLKFGFLYKLLPNTGMFPSGHTSVPFLGYLFSFDTGGIIYKILFFICWFLMAIFMLFSRGHYSIDIVGTIFISYSIVVFSQKHFKKYLVK